MILELRNVFKDISYHFKVTESSKLNHPMVPMLSTRSVSSSILFSDRWEHLQKSKRVAAEVELLRSEKARKEAEARDLTGEMEISLGRCAQRCFLQGGWWFRTMFIFFFLEPTIFRRTSSQLTNMFRGML